MGNRRRARELAMQALFFIDMRPDADDQDPLALFCRSCPPPKSSKALFTELVQGVRRHSPQIDRIIERFSSNWKISRMAGVDRNVMRLAVYEMLCCPDIPPKVSINEAIDIGKKYGTEESGAFINGILDAIHLAMDQEGLALSTDSIEAPPPSAPQQAPTVAVSAPEPPAETVRRVKLGRGLVRRRTVSGPVEGTQS
ncbi:MAG: transcription antitermination factor NusB [Desulfobacterales bacterium]|jgi:N utilization substance protein B|nr:transcription antitermination factor NusB [Desulfobacteraceae bacterium]MDY0310800.1 transcription antitermination factor NusB [Desulfobacterales bacterium]